MLAHATPDSAPAPRFSRALMTLVLLVAAGVRLAYVLQLRGTILFERPQGDAFLHLNLAQDIARGDWLGPRVFYYAPLYPYVVGVVFSIAGPSIWVVALLQVVLSTADVGLIMALARLTFGDRVASVAGGLAAVYGPFVFYTGFLLKETAGLFLFDAFLVVALWSAQRDDWRLGFLPGGLLGLSALVRPNLLPLAAAVMVWMWFVAAAQRRAKRAAGLLVFACGVAAAILPVSVRNYVVGHEWVWISAHGGHNFFIGNRLGATGLYQPLEIGGGQTPYDEEQQARAIAERAAGRPLRYAEVSAYWYRRGRSEIREHPRNFVRVTLRKFALFWNDYEVPDFQDLYFVRGECPALWLAPLSLGIVAPLAAAGVIASRRHWRSCLLLYLVIVGVLALVVPFFVFARYRLPVVPILIVFAAFGLVEIVTRLARWDWLRFAMAVAVVALVGLPVHWPIYRPDDFLATSYFNLGQLYQETGRTDAAVAAWKRAVQLNPDYLKPRRALGAAYFAAGRFADAAQTLRHPNLFGPAALQPDPDLTYMYGVSLQRTGNVDEAANILRAGRARWPNDPRFPAALAELNRTSR